MKLKYEFIIRELGDRYVAVAVGENAEEFSALVKMNKSGKIMMEMLKEDTTEDKMVAQLMEKYEGTEEFFREQVQKFVGGIRNSGALIE